MYSDYYISIHALRGEGDADSAEPKSITELFQSTPSVGRATQKYLFAIKYFFISIHALRGEGDWQMMSAFAVRRNFNPRPPWGGRQGEATRALIQTNISIHALRGEGDKFTFRATSATVDISIHALRGEGDRQIKLEAVKRIYFNPRPPWGGRRFLSRPRGHHIHFNPRPPWGGRLSMPFSLQSNTTFQSTPSVGRATILLPRAYDLIDISIHALRGEGDMLLRYQPPQITISIHALRGEGDAGLPVIITTNLTFQSTPSVGRATNHANVALRQAIYFNPRPPWGGRRK